MRGLWLLSALFLSFESLAQQIPDTREQQLMKVAPSQGRALTSRQPVKYLAVDYPGGRKRFFMGDELVMKVKGSRKKIRDNVFAVTDSSVVFAEYSEITNRQEYVEYPLKDIRKVYFLQGGGLAMQAGYLLPFAGAGYFVLDYFGPLWNQEMKGAPLKATPSTFIVSGGLIALGGIAYKSTHKALRIGHRNRLKVLQTF